MISKRVMDLLKQIASELLKNSKEVSKLDETTIIYGQLYVWIGMKFQVQTPVASPFVIPKCSDGEIGRHEGLKIP